MTYLIVPSSRLALLKWAPDMLGMVSYYNQRGLGTMREHDLVRPLGHAKTSIANIARATIREGFWLSVAVICYDSSPQ